MLKVSELMLGDWVKIKPNPYMHIYDLEKSDYDPETHPYLIVKVEQLSDYGINPIERWGDISWIVEMDIDGVELTPEILIKNGFKEDKEYWNGFYKYTFEETIPDDVKIPNSDIKFDGRVMMSIIYRVEDASFENFELDVYNKFGNIKISDFTKYDKLEGQPFYVHDIQHLFKLANINKEFNI